MCVVSYKNFVYRIMGQLDIKFKITIVTNFDVSNIMDVTKIELNAKGTSRLTCLNRDINSSLESVIYPISDADIIVYQKDSWNNESWHICDNLGIIATLYTGKKDIYVADYNDFSSYLITNEERHLDIFIDLVSQASSDIFSIIGVTNTETNIQILCRNKNKNSRITDIMLPISTANKIVCQEDRSGCYKWYICDRLGVIATIYSKDYVYNNATRIM